MDKITLQVGERIFETTESTLRKSNYFVTFLDRWELNSKKDKVFIDRNGEAFSHILNLLRDNNYHFPSEYLYELEFYQIDIPINIKEELTKVLKENLDNIEEMNCELASITSDISKMRAIMARRNGCSDVTSDSSCNRGNCVYDSDSSEPCTTNKKKTKNKKKSSDSDYSCSDCHKEVKKKKSKKKK